VSTQNVSDPQLGPAGLALLRQGIAAEDVFVPDYRTLAVAQITGGPNPGSPVNQSILYQLPAISLFAFCIAGVSLGIAKGAIEYFSETTRSRTSYYTGRNLADFVTLQVHLAEAAAITDSAEAVMLTMIVLGLTLIQFRAVRSDTAKEA
jgi:3-hydroxy-9,10-secoandrosta-1,3,5(10)-triene-9,17-dione monooxygenase